MDIFIADHRISGSDEFPQHISPFPDPTDLYANSSAVFHSTDIIDHRPPLPPQKLRPIRCNGRSPVGSQAENAIFDGALGNFQSIASPEVGFTGDLLCVSNIDSNEYFNSSVKNKSIEVAKDNGFTEIIANNCCLTENGENGGSDPAIAVEKISTSREGPPLDDDSCSTSDDDDIGSMEKPQNRKRKRRTTRSLELVMENLVMKVMDKQEQMHKQLIEMIEVKEKERIVREEAWKQGEIERIQRDEELRAQETTRSLAIISVMQNLLGQEIQISQPVENQCTEDDGSERNSQNELKNDPSNMKWPQSEVQALITLRTAVEHIFHASGSKESI